MVVLFLYQLRVNIPPHAGLITDGRFNSVNASYSWITNIVCDGDERALLECDVYNASTSCSFNTHIASQIGLQCYKG